MLSKNVSSCYRQPLKDVNALISEPDCVTLLGKRDFADVIKIKNFEMTDYLGLSG